MRHRHRADRPRFALAGLLLGLSLVVGAPSIWLTTRSPETVGADAARQLAEPTPRAPAAQRRADPPERETGPPRTRVTPAPRAAAPRHDARLRPERSAPPPRPVRIGIPALDVTAPVVPVGVHGDVVAIPSDVDTVGWYRFGGAPSDHSGSTVIIGHVDSADQGRGAFFEVSDLSPGAAIRLTTSDRVTHLYRVVAREEWPKRQVPTTRLFASTGAERLTLITCGGAFDEQTKSYVDNIAVTAVPERP
jgi:hypothetical protein